MKRLLRREPRHLGEGEEPHVAPRHEKRVGEPLQTAELRGEEVEPLGIALFLGPARAPTTRDEVPQLEVVARQVVGAFVELNLVPAARKTGHRDLERPEPPERGEEVSAKLPRLVAAGRGAGAAVGAATRLGLDAELAMTLVEALPEAL